MRLADGARRRDGAGRVPAEAGALPPGLAGARRATRARSASCAARRAVAPSSTGSTRAGGRLVEMRRFDGPREVLAFGNGALAVRGPCAAERAGGRAPRATGASASCRPAARGARCTSAATTSTARASSCCTTAASRSCARRATAGPLHGAPHRRPTASDSTHLPVAWPDASSARRGARAAPRALDGRLRGAARPGVARRLGRRGRLGARRRDRASTARRRSGATCAPRATCSCRAGGASGGRRRAAGSRRSTAG